EGAPFMRQAELCIASAERERPLLPPSGRGRRRKRSDGVASRGERRSARDRTIVSAASLLRLGLQASLQPPKLSPQAVTADGRRQERFQWSQQAMGVPRTHKGELGR